MMPCVCVYNALLLSGLKMENLYKIVQQNIREITQIAILLLYTVHCKPKSANRANVRQEMP